MIRPLQMSVCQLAAACSPEKPLRFDGVDLIARNAIQAGLNLRTAVNAARSGRKGTAVTQGDINKARISRFSGRLKLCEVRIRRVVG